MKVCSILHTFVPIGINLSAGNVHSYLLVYWERRENLARCQPYLTEGIDEFLSLLFLNLDWTLVTFDITSANNAVELW